MTPAKKRPKARARELREQITHHRRKYYGDDAPEISDAEYDALEQELKAIEAEHPELVSADSSTQRVGGEPSDAFVNVPHRKPLLSLDNAYSEADLRAWDERLSRSLAQPPGSYVVEPKIDGFSISLWYRDGLLERAVTRGDGTIGERREGKGWGGWRVEGSAVTTDARPRPDNRRIHPPGPHTRLHTSGSTPG